MLSTDVDDFWTGIGRMTGNKRLAFGDDPDHEADPGIFRTGIIVIEG